MKKERENKDKDKDKDKDKGGRALKDRGERLALLNILEDVDASRARAIEERNKTLAIITNFTDGLLVFDKENKLSLINPVTENFFEVRANEIVGKSLLELADLPGLKILINLLKKKTKRVFRKEVRIQKNLILEVSIVPLMEGKESLGILVILHDITREKMIEKVKTEFVSLAAHQLRTPLSAIKWTLRMILDEDLGKIAQEQAEFLEKTYKSNERMIGLVNALLNVTRIEEGRYLYELIFVRFEDLVWSVIKNFEREIKKKNIKFNFRKPETKVPEVRVDVEKMKLVISNLLDNAIRYTPAGGEVTISLKYSGKEIEFSVKDSGLGIPKDQQERVFAKFFRAANVIKMDTEGTGLGIFMAKNIIEAHKGKIWFESEENKGSTFYFTLPIRGELK